MKKVRVKKKRAKVVNKKSCATLKEESKTKHHLDLENPEDLALLRCMAQEDRASVATHEDAYKYLYPILEDDRFNEKIASKKEFYDSRYDQYQQALIAYINAVNIQKSDK